MRARIERPLPPEPVGPVGTDEAETEPGGEVTGQAAVEAFTPRAPAARAPTATSGPRPYLSETPR
jgi:penicillin-binding protein 2